MWENNPHEDALGSTVSDVIPFETRYAPEGRSTVIYRAAAGEPLEEVVLRDDGEVDPRLMSGWSKCGDVRFRTLAGTHFQFLTAPAELLAALAEDMLD